MLMPAWAEVAGAIFLLVISVRPLWRSVKAYVPGKTECECDDG